MVGASSAMGESDLSGYEKGAPCLGGAPAKAKPHRSLIDTGGAGLRQRIARHDDGQITLIQT